MARLDGRTRNGGEGRIGLGLFLSAIEVNDAIPGEAMLAAGILRQAILDVRARRPPFTKSIDEQRRAREFLLDRDALSIWASVLQVDVDWLQEQLAIAAGLSDDRPRLGERPGPAPRQQRPYTRRNLDA
jgi:hypothetical protein